jgi:polyribonucleotide nucleotidyltransferase
VGDTMMVKVIAVDEQDRVKLSRKAAMREMATADSDANGAP